MIGHKIKEFFNDASIYGLSQILGQLIGFFLIPLYTKELTPEDYGILTILGFYALFFGPISHLGIQGAMFRFVGLAKNMQEEKEYLSTSTFSILISTSIISTVSIFFLNYINKLFFEIPVQSSFLLYSILSAFFNSISQIPLTYLRIKRKIKVIFRLNIINLFFTIFLNIIFIIGYKMGLKGAVLAIFFSSLINLCIVFYYLETPSIKNFKFNKLHQMLGYGLPNVPHYLIAILMMFFGQFILNKYLGSNELGFYSIAWKFCLPLQAAVGIIHSSWSAYKYELVKTNEISISKGLFGDFISLIIGFYSFLFIGVIFFGKDLLILMTSPDYHISASYLPYLALIPFANGLYYVLGSGISFGVKQKLMPLISLSGCITTIILSYLFIPEYGINGAAFATSFGWLIMAILGFFYGQSLYKFQINLLNLFILASVLAAGFLISLFGQQLILLKILYLIFFVTILYFTLPHKLKESLKSKVIKS